MTESTCTEHGNQWQFLCAVCNSLYCNYPGCDSPCAKHKCEPQWLTDMRKRQNAQELSDREEEEMAGDFSTFCPVCGRVREDSKAHRLTMFIGDERVAIIPKGTPFTRAKSIAKGVPNAYLMAETIDPETDRILYSVQVFPHKPRPLYEFAD